jgi:preprotein translocase subunit SecF
MEIIKPGTQIPFLSYRRWGFMLSSVLIVGVVLLLFTKGPNLGVDFEGGTMVHVKFQDAVTIGQLRAALEQSPLGGVVQDFGGGGTDEYLIRMEKSEAQIGTVGKDIRDVLTQSFGDGSYEVLRVESVGPKVGDDLRRRGILSVIFATIMMGAYIWIRFELRFGLGAIVALIHDVLITLGALVVADFELDLPIVAALLTIAGYSVNDTVVICDRIRENMRKRRRDPMETIINTSINETLGRTILTTVTSLLVLTALLVLGGGVIRPFAFTLFVGFLAGLYSTIFVATPTILLMERGRRR